MPKPVNTSARAQEPVKGPVDKAMEVLEVLVADGGGPHRLGEIARRTGLAKPTVHRHLRAMAEQGFARPAEGGSYRPGPRLLGLAAAALDTSPDLALARPALRDLRTRTGLRALYAVRDADEYVLLELSEPAGEYGCAARPGDRAPLHRGGPGLAILSALPAAEADAVLAAAKPLRAAVHARNGPGALRAEAAAAARRGYALDDGYEEPDVRCLAAPVTEADGRVVGALGVRGLAFVLGEESVALYGPMVRAAARALSAGLGGRRLEAVAEAGES
ncbi:IclR family transcriptional regulator [Streptomyces sp. NPDC050560]|uniref:IclR family transcriptional regulator n=1 Tax=Streptomyces sp. NPDC050560 TaxID=3365630 RepID=UPI00379D994C